MISVAHSLEGLITEFDDGSCLYYDKSLTKKAYKPFLGAAFAALGLAMAKGTHEELAEKFDAFQNRYARLHLGRVEEWVKDSEAALAYAREHLGDLIDFEKGIGVTGHSFGGDTAYALCLRDPAVACGVNIDGAPFGNYREAILEKPFLQVSCKGNEKLASRVYIRHTAPVWKALFRNMQHVGFSDMKHMVRMGAMMGRMNPDVMHENLCRCHLELFDTYLKKEKDKPDLNSNGDVEITEFPPDQDGDMGT